MGRSRLRLLGWRSHKKVHLWPGPTLFRHLENDRERMTQRDRREARQKIGVLGVVPIRGELIGAADVDCPVVHGQRLSRLEPRLERLLWELLLGTIEQAAPSFVGGERQECGMENLPRGGAKLDRQCGKSNQARATRFLIVQALLPYPTVQNRFTSSVVTWFVGSSLFSLAPFLESPWVSPPIVPATSAVSKPTGFVRAWKPNGDVQS